MTIRPKIRVFIDIYLSFAHDHSTKSYDLLSFIYSFFVHDHSTKNRVLINLLFLLVHDHSTKLRVTLLRCANISFAIFMADNALIFLLLCFWQYCLYNSSAIFIAVLPISFVHYIHRWEAALIIFCALYPWL